MIIWAFIATLTGVVWAKHKGEQNGALLRSSIKIASLCITKERFEVAYNIAADNFRVLKEMFRIETDLYEYHETFQKFEENARKFIIARELDLFRTQLLFFLKNAVLTLVITFLFYEVWQYFLFSTIATYILLQSYIYIRGSRSGSLFNVVILAFAVYAYEDIHNRNIFDEERIIPA